MEAKDFLNEILALSIGYKTTHLELIEKFNEDPTECKYNVDEDFLWENDSISVNFDDGDDVLDMYQNFGDFLTEAEEFKFYPAFRLNYTAEASSNYGDSAYISDNEVRASWKVPKEILSEEIYERAAKRVVKERVQNLLRPESYTSAWPRNIDCKFLALWVEEKIDWETLQSIVYSDCQL